MRAPTKAPVAVSDIEKRSFLTRHTVGHKSMRNRNPFPTKLSSVSWSTSGLLLGCTNRRNGLAVLILEGRHCDRERGEQYYLLPLGEERNAMSDAKEAASAGVRRGSPEADVKDAGFMVRTRRASKLKRA